MSRKAKGREAARKREAGYFYALPHAVVRSDEFAGLSPFATKLFMDLLAQYRGDNNGDLCAAWKLMAARRWRSRDSLSKAIRELREKDFIVLTRQGGRHCASLYAITFQEIDWCNGKLDIKAPSRDYMGAWRRLPVGVEPIKSVARPAGQLEANQHAGRVKGAVAA